MAINNIFLGTTNTDIIVSAANEAITVIYFCNTSGSAVTIQVYAVPNGDSPTTQNKIYQDVSIPAGDTYIVDKERLVLEAGDRIVATCSVPGVVSTTVSSMEV